MTSRQGSVSVVVTLALAIAFSACGGGASNTRSENQKTVERLDMPGKLRVAQSYYESGRTADAIAVVQRAIEAEPDSAAALNFLGQLYLLTDRLDEAEAALERALQADPYFTDAHNNLGAVYDRMGRKDAAEKQFRAVLADPGYPTPEKAYHNLGLLYESQGRPDQAIKMLRKSVGVNPKYYPGHYDLAGLLEQAGNLGEAAELYEVAAPGYRESPDYHFRLGLTYLRLERELDAREHLGRVIQLSPGSENSAKAREILAMMEE